MIGKLSLINTQDKVFHTFQAHSVILLRPDTFSLYFLNWHLKIFNKSKGREQITVTHDFMPFTLEALQTKYLLFFSRKNIIGKVNWLVGWLVDLTAMSSWAEKYLLVKYYLFWLSSNLEIFCVVGHISILFFLSPGG